MNPVFAHMLGRFHGFLTAERPPDSASAMALMKEMIQWPAPPIAQPVPVTLDASAFITDVNALCEEIRQQFNGIFEASFVWSMRSNGGYLFYVGSGGNRVKVLEIQSDSNSTHADIEVLCYYQNENLQCSEVIDHAITFIPNSPTQDLWTGSCMFVDFENKKVIPVPVEGYPDTKDTILAMLVATFVYDAASNKAELTPWPQS